ncbi:3-mercaptopyruvate sulfurtransferase [Cellulophaga algicola DSM 14237]|uniref:3-mercaptopyruvate sulfurtransferase n=1 Tax=Cellulophaga algicola (strain DSM 14237 / IC166 / ACAM 630) TaxID=688270 RepID=E6X9E0_CELAD|nr:sulfurtransferase [Cellulophaga algicola]ADV47679.1 3-mercaptopyruvate sulfurtransferase [Cellulophaga algicola DSM 14237]
MRTIQTSIVSSKWLQAHLNDSNLIILDASAANPMSGALSENISTRIVGARYFDLKTNFSETENPYPNKIPSPEQFQEECQNLGINQNSLLVVYDAMGIYWSPRVWWLFKAMGHVNIAVLDGGLPEWIHHNLPLEENKKETYVRGNFTASFNSEMVVDFNSVLENTISEVAILIDARSQGRFNGTAAEPRKDLRSGSIPNSINIPYTTVLDNHKFKDKTELLQLFENVKNDVRPLVFSCGSGVTACILLLASELVGIKNKKSVYDGSWTEWAQKVL